MVFTADKLIQINRIYWTSGVAIRSDFFFTAGVATRSELIADKQGSWSSCSSRVVESEKQLRRKSNQSKVSEIKFQSIKIH